MTDWRLPDWLFLPVYACFQMCWLFSWTAELASPWPCQGWVRARKKFTISLFLVALIYKGFSAFQVKVITHSNANPAPASWNWMICLSSNLQGHYGVSWTLRNYLFPLSATKWNLLRTHLWNLARHDDIEQSLRIWRHRCCHVLTVTTEMFSSESIHGTLLKVRILRFSAWLFLYFAWVPVI